jgi:hypothetical protein
MVCFPPVRLALLLFIGLTTPVLAQDTPQNPPPAPTAPPPDATPTDQAPPSQPPPQNGQPQGQTIAPPEVTNEPAAPPDTGPGVLTRGFTLSPLQNQQIRFQPYLALSGIADDGLTAVATKNNQLVQQQNYGVDFAFGITGRRVYKKDSIELEFHGDLYHYTPDSYYDGGNYFLMLTYLHQFSRRVSMALTENAGLYSNNFSVQNGAVDLSSTNTNLLATPGTQLFDNNTLYLSTAADVIIQKSARWSFDLGGTGFLVRRASSSLYGTTGATARVDTNYRFTRRLTAGAYYSYTNYQFNKAFGGSGVNTAGMILSYSLSKRLQFRFRGGGSRVVTNGTQVILLDPVIAAILGYTQGVIAIHRMNYIPDISAQLFSQYKVGTASLEFIESITPGNGLFLTSRRTSISGHYDYTGIRRWTFTAGGSYDDLITLGVLVGEYRSYSARLAATRVLHAGFQATLSGEYRRFDISDASFLRNSYRVSLGVAWSPSERPLKLW